MSWAPRRLDQLGYLARGRSRHRPRDAAHLYDGPYPFIQTSDVKHAALYINGHQQTYSEAGLEQSRLWPAGTLCITIAANIADTAILGIDACFPDSVIGFIPDEKKADTRFVKYLFDVTIQRQVQQFTQGAAQDNLSQEKLVSIEFSVPSVDEQRRIADVLSAYDGLIENNRRRMALLEDAARQIYREWFVRLRFPGHEHTQIAGGVPAGWERIHLGDFVETQYGYTETATMEPIGPKFLRGTDINKTAYIDWSTVPYCPIDETVQRKYRLRVGDIVVIRMADPGKVAIVERDIEAVFASYLIRLVPTDQRLTAYYLFYVLSDEAYQGFVRGVSTGATRKTASAPLLVDFHIILPPSSLLRAFEDSIRPLRQQITVLLIQDEKLRAARDLLLPRLMSGELAV